MMPQQDKFDTISSEELLGFLNPDERKYAPDTFYYAGDLELIRAGPKVSVVGSRDASEAAQKRTRDIVRALVRQGCVVVSGLARGIDTIAHREAIAAGGKTIAVLGTPLGQPSPISNQGLLDDIMKEHLALSQFAASTPVARGNFPQRNRTMALVSEATIIVEAGGKSGTQHQGWEAIRLDRTIFLDKTLEGTHAVSWFEEMEKYGAISFSTDKMTSMLDIIEEIGMVIGERYDATEPQASLL